MPEHRLAKSLKQAFAWAKQTVSKGIYFTLAVIFGIISTPALMVLPQERLRALWPTIFIPIYDHPLWAISVLVVLGVVIELLRKRK